MVTNLHQPERSTDALRGSPVGVAFVGFTVVVFALVVLAFVELGAGTGDRAALAAQLGLMGATLYGLSGMLAAYRAVKKDSRSTGAIAMVLLGPGAAWCWVVFVDGAGTGPVPTTLVALAAAGLAIALLSRGLRFAHWLDVYAGLGSLTLLLITAVVRSYPDTSGDSAALALLAVTGGMVCLYGSLVEMEQSEERSLVELYASKYHIESELERVDEVLHDLRSGLLAIEGAISTFEGELAAPVRAEAARLRRLTVRRQRVMAPFDLVDTVQAMVATRQAAGVTVDLRSPRSARVWGEENEVLSVIDNLLSNAERHGDSTPIRIQISERGGTTSLSVSNGGSSLLGDDRETVFERGMTTHPDGEGIGLTRARLLAKMNLGDLVLAPAADGVTTFTLDLRSDPPVAAG